MNEMEWDQMISDCGKEILRFCRMLAGDSREGDDLYQDTMLILLEKGERLDPMNNIKSYDVSVSIRLWKNRNRKFARRSQLAEQESLEALEEQGISPGESVASPEETLIRRMQIQMVRQTVNGLPERYRLPIQLFYSGDLTVGEIAHVLNLSPNTVKSRLHRAKEMIKNRLEEMEYDRQGI